MTILLKDDPAIAKAHERYLAFTNDDQARMAYEARIAFQRDQLSREETAKQQGLEQGLEQGIEQGKLEGKQETARNLKAIGMSIQHICQVTGLSVEEIEKL